MSNETPNPYVIGEPQVPTIRELTGHSKANLAVIVLGELLSINYATNGTGKRTLHLNHFQVKGVFSKHHDALINAQVAQRGHIDNGLIIALIPSKGFVTIIPAKKLNKFVKEFSEVTYLSNSVLENCELMRKHQLNVHVDVESGDCVVTL